MVFAAKEIVRLIALLAGGHIVLVWVMAVWRGLRAQCRYRSEKAHTPDIWPFVSVIIPAWQERGTLEFCIAALKKVVYPRWEAVIVAGGPDGTHEAARAACASDGRFRVIEQRPRGKNAALNEGLRMASGEVIVLLDADSRVAPGWLRALVAPINESILATTGKAVPLRQTPVSLGEQMELIAAYEIHNATTLQGSGGIAVRREVIEEMGGFPEDVWVGVDWDLNARLAARGVARAFCPQAVVHTERPATLREYWQNEVRWRRAHLSSLFRLPGYFLRNPVSALSNLYLYILSWFNLLFGLTANALVLIRGDEIGIYVLALWLTFLAWILLRRASLAGEVFVYTRDLRWLRLVWVPPLLLSITLAACVIATLTWKRQERHFKGPRPNRFADGD